MYSIINVMGTLELKCHNHNDYPLLYKQAEQLAISLGRFLEYRKCNLLVATQALVHCLIGPHLPSGAARPRASYIHIRQCTCACVTTITYYLTLHLIVKRQLYEQNVSVKFTKLQLGHLLLTTLIVAKSTSQKLKGATFLKQYQSKI